MYAPNEETFFRNLCQRYPYSAFDRNWLISEVASFCKTYGLSAYTEIGYLNYSFLNADRLITNNQEVMAA
jgi:hypothetical protein